VVAEVSRNRHVSNELAILTDRKKLRVAGLMSGTSADGVDVAIVDIGGRKVEVVAFDTRPYSADLRRRVFDLFDPQTGRVDDVCHMNLVLGEVFAESLLKTAKKKRVPLGSIDLIGSHGQTIYHNPKGRRYGNRLVRSTLQIGEPSVIAERTGITTVADFRPRDMAAGGQGAPLVPYTDWLLFAHKRKTRAIQNIGGIANVTYLPASGGIDDVLAFDTGPGNMVIDRVVKLVTHGRLSYDAAGRLAAKGTISEQMLAGLMRHRYLRCKPPKTTGREEFGTPYADALYTRAVRRRMDPLDILATVTAFTARSIADANRRFLPQPVDEVILCGGGALNQTLVGMLRKQMPSAKVAVTDDYGISVDAKEAVSFAILAYETVHGRCNNVPSATGASHPVVLGKVVPGRR
jgi:anhydro-N-acetylmuramic acid kinase